MLGSRRSEKEVMVGLGGKEEAEMDVVSGWVVNGEGEQTGGTAARLKIHVICVFSVDEIFRNQFQGKMVGLRERDEN